MHTHIYEASAAAMEILYNHLHIYTGCVDIYTCTSVWPKLQSVLHSEIRISTPAHSLWYKPKITPGSELVVKIKLECLWDRSFRFEASQPGGLWFGTSLMYIRIYIQAMADPPATVTSRTLAATSKKLSVETDYESCISCMESRPL